MNTSNTDYETLSHKTKLKAAVRNAVIVLVICLVVIAPALWWWGQSESERQTLREAKNVVLNMNLLGIEAYGFEESVIDKNRESGLSESAEEKIYSFSGAEGEIRLISWSKDKNCVITMDYMKERWLVEYTYDLETEQEEWDVYWNLKNYYN